LVTCPPFESTDRRLCDLPDGFAFEPVGHLYAACYEPSRVLRVSTDGTAARSIGDEEVRLFCCPTNLAFRGGTLSTTNLGRWHITAVETDVEGLPLPVNA